MPLGDPQKRAFYRLERAGYMPEMGRLAHALGAPFWWHGEDEAGRYRIFYNGTVCFLHTEPKVIAVTAEHVYAQYLRDKKRYSAFSAQMGNSTVEPEKYLIDFSEELDLATFSLPDILLAATGVAIHHPVRWPPEPIAEREVVLFGGFPGILREERTTTAELPFGRLWRARPAAARGALSTRACRCDRPQGPRRRLQPEYYFVERGRLRENMNLPMADQLELRGFIDGKSGCRAIHWK